jgi:hypothetical protein
MDMRMALSGKRRRASVGNGKGRAKESLELLKNHQTLKLNIAEL